MSGRRVRAWLAPIAVIVAAPVPGSAQTATPTTAKELSLQFAVPASPAFKLVEVDASSVLRPTSFHQFASTLGDLGTSGGNFAVPKELGFEIAPFFLSRGSKLSMRRSRCLLRSSASRLRLRPSTSRR